MQAKYYSAALPAASTITSIAPAHEYFGLDHQPIGQATLSADPEGLRVGNLGSAGR